jgi:hypothetical protein
VLSVEQVLNVKLTRFNTSVMVQGLDYG